MIGLVNMNIGRRVKITAFTPSSISGGVVWIDATDAASITNVSGAASQINDKFGNGNHLEQATAGNRPVIMATGGQNNLPYLQFNSSRTIGKASFVLPQPFSVFWVMKQKSYSNVKYILQFGNNYGIAQYGGNGPRGATGNSLSIVATDNYVFSGTLKDKLYNTSYAPYQALFQGLDSYIGMDFINDYIGATSPGSATTSSITIGGDVDFHELIIYNRQLTSAEARQVNTYLKNKYALSVRDKLVCFGDSITAGFNAGGTTFSFPLCYATLAATELSKDLYVNYGVGGQNLTQNMNMHLPRFLSGLASGQVTINLGQNDSDSALPAWKTNYEGYIQQILSVGWNPQNIILQSPAPTSSGATNSGLNTAVSQLATQYGLKYCNQWQYIKDRVAESYSVGDSIHPDTEGHRHMADNLKISLQA